VKPGALAAAAGLALLVSGSPLAADEPPVKPAIRGLVSMGAYRFVGAGGDPVNTLEPLRAKPGIFGGLVVIASWAQLQPTPDAELQDGNAIDKAMADVRAYNAEHPDKPLAVRLRVWGGFMAPEWAMRLGGPPIVALHKKTRIVLPVNPLRTGRDEGAGDPEFTEQVMRDCRRQLGVRCVFDNHNLDTDLPKPLVRIYALMKQLGPEIVFQTYRTNPSDFEGTIRMGVAQGATSIELWQDYRGFPEVANAKLKHWAGLVEANKTP
jgi:hypothetical protein